ncbi:hypothetical protein [Corynebacterium sp. HMSC075D04]|uniref:hypothetical protein n=1 Tax=Corynebacterium sp. HMSC075D04 TaxID=1739540 RepID=UPI00114CC258|nr:hypothetical protein [Corynebacterium sp. HMSC075D04]
MAQFTDCTSTGTPAVIPSTIPSTDSPLPAPPGPRRHSVRDTYGAHTAACTRPLPRADTGHTADCTRTAVSAPAVPAPPQQPAPQHYTRPTIAVDMVAAASCGVAPGCVHRMCARA